MNEATADAAQPALKSARFRKAREAEWLRLERLLDTLQSKPLSRLSDEDLLAIPVLYRATLSALSVARETSLDRGLLDYLESLSARAYFVVYGARPSLRSRLAKFFCEDWPAAARALWRESLLSGGLMAAGAVVAALMIAADPTWYDAFIPRSLAGGRGMDSSAEALRAILYSTKGRNMLEVFAAFLFTHNAQIALLAFALGFAFGVPTALLVFTNGCALGAIMMLYARHGLLLPLTGWLMIHGVTELWATALAGAAGFHIGWTLAFPGERTRMQAMAQAGRRASVLMAGVVIMLMLAGLLEGIGRQLITSDLARYVIALTTAVGWGAYLYAPRSRR